MKNLNNKASNWRRSVILMALLVLISLSGLADEDNKEQQLLMLLDRFLAGAATDAGVHEAFWAEDLVYTSSGGERFGKAEIMSGMESAAEPSPLTPRYRAENPQVNVFGETAVVAFRLMAETPQSGSEQVEQSEYFNTGTFVLRAGQWKAVAWQATRIPEEE